MTAERRDTESSNFSHLWSVTLGMLTSSSHFNKNKHEIEVFSAGESLVLQRWPKLPLSVFLPLWPYLYVGGVSLHTCVWYCWSRATMWLSLLVESTYVLVCGISDCHPWPARTSLSLYRHQCVIGRQSGSLWLYCVLITDYWCLPP